MLSSYNGVEAVKVPVKVNVLSSGFTLRLDSSDFSVYPGESVNVPVTLSSVNGFTGPVNLTVTGLPQGVTAQPKTINLTGSSVSINLVLSADASTAVSRANFAVMAENADAKAQQNASVTVYPSSVKVAGISVFSSALRNAVDADGNIWLSGKSGFLKVKPDLSLNVVNATAPICGLTVGQDGGIWMATEPYSRLNPATGVLEQYASPRGFSGCAGSYQFDAKRRNWETYFGLFRLDLINQKAEKVPGTEDLNGYVRVKDNTVWLSTGSNVLYTVNSDTLALTKYSLPGTSVPADFYPQGGKVYFLDSDKIAVFDPATETVSRCNTGAWRISTLHGVDNGGNAWVSATQYDVAGGSSRQALLRLSPSGAVFKELPALNGSFAVSPSGGLWFTNINYSDFRVAYIAP